MSRCPPCHLSKKLDFNPGFKPYKKFAGNNRSIQKNVAFAVLNCDLEGKMTEVLGKLAASKGRKLAFDSNTRIWVVGTDEAAAAACVGCAMRRVSAFPPTRRTRTRNSSGASRHQH